jgi:hypothetical protein
MCGEPFRGSKGKSQMDYLEMNYLFLEKKLKVVIFFLSLDIWF